MQYLEDTNLVFLAAAANCDCRETMDFAVPFPVKVTGRRIKYILFDNKFHMIS